MLFSDGNQATLGAQVMKGHWVKLMHLEQARLVSATAKRLVDDLVFLRNTPVRMMYLLYERDSFQASSPDGLKLLRGLLEVLPDNKVVEDVHNSIRRDSKANPNRIQSTTHVQQLTTCSPVLEERGPGGQETCAASLSGFE